MSETKPQDQLLAQRYLQERGIMIDPEDLRSEIEVAKAFGCLALGHGGIVGAPEGKTTV